MNAEETVLDKLETRILRWYGHVQRMNEEKSDLTGGCQYSHEEKKLLEGFETTEQIIWYSNE